jgi:prophage DNA circulation protein
LRQQQNQDDLTDLVEASALAQTSALIIDLAIENQDDGESILAATSAIFDRLLERGNLEDDIAQRLRTMRADLFAHLRRLTFDLNGLDRIIPPATVPAILLAWDLYGDATRGDEIVIRNAIEHPGYVQGGAEIVVSGV